MSNSPSIHLDHHVLYSPPAEVTWHGKGFTNPENGTVDDKVSASDIAVILGITTALSGNSKKGNWSIWPLKKVFQEEFRGWDREWNQYGEEWFTNSWQLKDGHAKVRLSREWRHSLGRDHSMNIPKEVAKVPLEIWRTVADDLQAGMAPLQPSKHLMDQTDKGLKPMSDSRGGYLYYLLVYVGEE